METNLKSFYSGDSVNFFVTNNDYDNTYTCKVFFIKDNLKYEFDGNYEENKFNFIVTSNDSEKIKKNKYRVFALFKKNDFVKTEVLKDIDILDNVMTSSCIDTTTYNQKMLLAIEDLIVGRMQDDYVSYKIGNRSITKMSPDSLIKYRDYFEEKVNLENQYNVNGINKGNKIKIKWVGRFNGN